MENINIYHRLIFGDSGNDIIFLKLIYNKIEENNPGELLNFINSHPIIMAEKS